MDAPADGRPETDDTRGEGAGFTGADDGDPGSAEPAGSADSLERLLALVGPRVDEVRSLLGDSTSRWRGDALRVGEGTRHRLRDVFRELGLVTRDEWDELELKVAQIEHRLNLLERRADEGV